MARHDFGQRNLYSQGDFKQRNSEIGWNELEQRVRHFSGDDILAHSIHTADYSLELNDTYRGNELVVALGALLHDVAWGIRKRKDRMFKHPSRGARFVSRYFMDVIPEHIINQVREIIEYHAPWDKEKDPSLELKVVYDAEKINYIHEHPGNKWNYICYHSTYFELSKEILVLAGYNDEEARQQYMEGFHILSKSA